MFRLVCLCALVALAASQERVAKAARYTDDPRVAAILSEQRYLSGDGTFGSAYTQEDGVDFKEESDAAGNRKGSYSYVDPSGQRRTISYTAGKNGFVATGDHLPQGPAGPAAQAAPAPRYQAAPAQSYQAAPAPRYETAPQQFSRPSNPNEDDGQYYPELYEREDSPAPARAQYSAPAPQPQYRAPQQQQQYSGVQQPQYSAPQPQPQYSQPQYTAPQQQQFSGVQRAAAPAPQQYFTPQEERTQAPSRFFPPGKLDLNRSPDGYSYSFSSKV